MLREVNLYQKAAKFEGDILVHAPKERILIDNAGGVWRGPLVWLDGRLTQVGDIPLPYVGLVDDDGSALPEFPVAALPQPKPAPVIDFTKQRIRGLKNQIDRCEREAAKLPDLYARLAELEDTAPVKLADRLKALLKG
jgi:hypothetical protein